MSSRLVLVDSNVILDVLSEDPDWFSWSSAALAAESEANGLAINPIVYAEIAPGFARAADLDLHLSDRDFKRLPLPWPAAFLAGRCHVRYRRAGGTRRSPMPDFYIGAHAAVEGMRVLTRDPTRYRTYFPQLELIAP